MYPIAIDDCRGNALFGILRPGDGNLQGFPCCSAPKKSHCWQMYLLYPFPMGQLPDKCQRSPWFPLFHRAGSVHLHM